jgi:hypothetical protein
MQRSRGNAGILSSHPDDRLLFRVVSTSEEVGRGLVHRPISPCEGIAGGSVIAVWVASFQLPKRSGVGFPVGSLPSCQPKPAVLPRSRVGRFRARAEAVAWSLPGGRCEGLPKWAAALPGVQPPGFPSSWEDGQLRGCGCDSG